MRRVNRIQARREELRRHRLRRRGIWLEQDPDGVWQMSASDREFKEAPFPTVELAVGIARHLLLFCSVLLVGKLAPPGFVIFAGVALLLAIMNIEIKHVRSAGARVRAIVSRSRP